MIKFPGVAIAAALVTIVIVLAAVFAPYIAPKNPYDLTQISILDSNNPPICSRDCKVY